MAKGIVYSCGVNDNMEYMVFDSEETATVYLAMYAATGLGDAYGDAGGWQRDDNVDEIVECKLITLESFAHIKETVDAWANEYEQEEEGFKACNDRGINIIHLLLADLISAFERNGYFYDDEYSKYDAED